MINHIFQLESWERRLGNMTKKLTQARLELQEILLSELQKYQEDYDISDPKDQEIIAYHLAIKVWKKFEPRK